MSRTRSNGLGRSNLGTQSQLGGADALQSSSEAPTVPKNSMSDSQPDLSKLNLPVLKQVQVLIPNLHIVSPALLRGAQPSAQALLLIKQSGVRTIVNLRNEPVLVEEEASQVRTLGLNYVNIPMDVFSHPSADSLQRFLAVVAAPENQPVYVHCQHGEDRTGTMCAIYRIGAEGWPLEKAYQEMLAYGYKPVLVNLSAAVLEFANSHSHATASHTVALSNPISSTISQARDKMQNFLRKKD